jgi:hypothetical protein
MKTDEGTHRSAALARRADTQQLSTSRTAAPSFRRKPESIADGAVSCVLISAAVMDPGFRRGDGWECEAGSAFRDGIAV